MSFYCATKCQYILAQWRSLVYKKIKNEKRPEKGILLFCPYRAHVLNNYRTQGFAIGLVYARLSARRLQLISQALYLDFSFHRLGIILPFLYQLLHILRQFAIKMHHLTRSGMRKSERFGM